MEQLEKLIIKPYQYLHAVGPLVIVIDALDESGDQSCRRHLLRTISTQINENTIPAHLRFFITARPESDILAALASCPHLAHKHIGDIPVQIADEDIRKFIQSSLGHCPELESLYPNQEWCRLLVQCSQRIFQWAVTACNFIQDDASGLTLRDRFKLLVQPDNSDDAHPLDKLYRTVLEQQFALDTSRSHFREVMAVVLALQEPLSMKSLSAIFAGELKFQDIIKPLESLLGGVLDEEKPIRPLHSSFRDFLLDEARSSIFHVRIQPQHSLRLGRASLACMRKMLRFNICDLKDSRTRNTAIPDLPHRVSKAIPPHLAYSCRYWMHHLQFAACTPDLLNELTLFFKGMFPYWLEAISLLSLSSPQSVIQSALETCTILMKWTKVS